MFTGQRFTDGKQDGYHTKSVSSQVIWTFRGLNMRFSKSTHKEKAM